VQRSRLQFNENFMTALSKLFSFFKSWYFLNEIENNMFSMIPSIYRTTHESFEELEKR